jgi:phosphoesterase RecJ-like protein
LSIKNVNLAAIFKEDLHLGIVKISFRSKGDFDVNLFARNHFNGGGHKNAAGGRSELSLKATINKFKALVEAHKLNLNEAV